GRKTRKYMTATTSAMIGPGPVSNCWTNDGASAGLADAACAHAVPSNNIRSHPQDRSNLRSPATKSHSSAGSAASFQPADATAANALKFPDAIASRQSRIKLAKK